MKEDEVKAYLAGVKLILNGRAPTLKEWQSIVADLEVALTYKPTLRDYTPNINHNLGNPLVGIAQ